LPTPSATTESYPSLPSHALSFSLRPFLELPAGYGYINMFLE
jgi:hypothetical protein